VNEIDEENGAIADCVVIGGGPAGLTAAYELSKLGRRSIVLEADDDVGGISKTCEFEGYRYDIGGHRFFTKVDYVQALWEEILGDEFLIRPRLSRIHYRGRMFDYPLKPMNALRGLGLVESARIGLSYAVAMIFPHREEQNFEQWVSNRFGKRLYEIFFRTYTEKVWGMPCTEISAEWAGQRIKNLDLRAAVLNAILGSRKTGGGEISTLIEEFQYPRFGPGQMWNSCKELLRRSGNEVRLETMVTQVLHDGESVTGVRVEGKNEAPEDIHGAQFLSSMPIDELVRAMNPPAPAEVRRAADRLRHRDFMTVTLIVDRPDLFPDNWVYIHSDDVHVGRIQNFKNWSPDMVPDPAKSTLGLEYFVQEGDELWSMPDEELLSMARRECDHLGLAPAEAIESGTVLRVRKAYPIYDDGYKESLATIRGWLEGFENLQLIGRNGQHRYNNQDHSMMTGVFAARNIAGEEHDVWAVNVEKSYHEEREATATPKSTLLHPDLDELTQAAFGRFDPIALGAAFGLVLGTALFLATSVLLLRGDDPLGPNLSLVGAYFLGYKVSWGGALLGMVEAGLFGFVFGWVMAKMVNLVVAREERRLREKVEASMAMDLLEG
jgi:protoporphyrinogen oxidase